MVRITIEDQIISDFKEFFTLTDRIFADRTADAEEKVIMVPDYLTLLGLVIDHTRWVMESYPEASDGKDAEMKAV